MVYRIPLDYQPDSAELFECIRSAPYAVFLDSGKPRSETGRYDILAASPSTLVISHAGESRVINTADNSLLQRSNKSPLLVLKNLLQQQGMTDAVADRDCDLPFNGGALGYFSYDLGRYLETLPSMAQDDIHLADMQVGIYHWAISVDHQRQQSWLIYRHRAQQAEMEALALTLNGDAGADTNSPAGSVEGAFALTRPFRSNLSATEYASRFSRTLDYIQAGDCYQINLAQRFSAGYSGDSWHAYKHLRTLAPTPFSAYLSHSDSAILSLSPERFLQVRELSVETKPIKGTRPRGATAEQDAFLREELASSDKDRAENLMIVDLLRNDLGKTCVAGSIAVPSLFSIESYANVHHLVSTVTGQLRQPDQALDLLAGCFPGGSITGAPKLRAMEIIEQLEPHRRSAYCGSIGYIAFNGNLDTSIAIRTLVAKDEQIHCWAGGGIVADSVCQAEYQETFDKVNNLIQALEQRYLCT